MPNFKLVAKAKTPAGSNMTLLFSLLSNCKHNVWCSRELTLKAKNSHFLKATFKDLYKILIKRHINYRLVLIFTLFPQWVANQAWEEVGEKTNQVLFLTTILFHNLVNHFVAIQNYINQVLFKHPFVNRQTSDHANEGEVKM